jgi:ribonucleoside-diphosphate reductase alpha chain
MSQMNLIRQNAVRGAFVDQSISFNLFYDGTDGKYISDMYIQAWKLGVKTVYYLRTKSATEIEKSTVDSEISYNIYDCLLEEGNSSYKVCRIDDPDCEACQ